MSPPLSPLIWDLMLSHCFWGHSWQTDLTALNTEHSLLDTLHNMFQSLADSTHWGWWQRQILWQAGIRCNTKLNRPTSIQLGECSALWGKLEWVVWSNCVAQAKPFLPKCSLQCSPASVGLAQACPNYVRITTTLGDEPERGCLFNVLSWHPNHGICHCLLFHQHAW